MASDSALSDARLEAPGVSAIENEIPTYRAITPLAVGSLVAGFVSILSYANLWFVLAGVAAIVLGVAAQIRIKRQPDAITGKGLANAGMALGLICGLSALTLAVTQDILTRRGAERFTRDELIPVLEAYDLDSALWYRRTPRARSGMSPSEARKQMENPNDKTPMAFEMVAGSVVQLVRDIEHAGGAKLTFNSVLQTGTIGVTPFAVVVADIEWPEHDHKGEAEDAHRKPLGDQVAFIIKSERQDRREMWWVDEYVYPYEAGSDRAVPKPAAGHGGHGHSH